MPLCPEFLGTGDQTKALCRPGDHSTHWAMSLALLLTLNLLLYLPWWLILQILHSVSGLATHPCQALICLTLSVFLPHLLVLFLASILCSTWLWQWLLPLLMVTRYIINSKSLKLPRPESWTLSIPESLWEKTSFPILPMLSIVWI